MAVPRVLDPAARLTFLETVIADHDDCDAAGYCLGCRRHGMWAAYPCDTRLGAERAAEGTRTMLGRPGAAP